HAQGTLPGGLNVKRRATPLNKKLLRGSSYTDLDSWIKVIKEGGNSFNYTLDWVSCFALADYLIFCEGNAEDKIIPFLLTASEVGSIFKKGATISAAMGGCQAEIGV